MRHMFRIVTAIGLFASIAVFAGKATAADPVPLDKRIDRIEKQLHAVQRKVFPGGAPIEPDITAQAQVAAPLPTSTPVTDLIARVTALESQLATLTGQVEQNSYKLQKLDERLTKMKAEMAAAQAPGASATTDGQGGVSAPSTPAGSSASPPPTAMTNAAIEARKAAVAAIERPATGDAANDAYVYGFRLWDAKFYPEAQAQLKATVEKYGDTPIGSRARNLLGRAYLDDDKPALASVSFYENYQKQPNGDRAAQSLAYLGEALIQLKKPADACKVYGELEKSYGSSLTSDLRTMMDKGRTRAKCGH